MSETIKIIKTIKTNCYGVIVLDLENKKTILVKTHDGHLSFPKGKYEKKKDKSYFDCALRELEEETGIDRNSIQIDTDMIFDEINSLTGNIPIKYYVGFVKNYVQILIKFDSEELESVNWYDFDKILELDGLKDQRKILFTNIRNHYKI